MKRHTERKNKRQTLKEPMVTYPSKRIFFSSFTEQEEENYHFWLKLTPEQRIENTTTLIRHAFADQLRLPSKNNRIVFDIL